MLPAGQVRTFLTRRLFDEAKEKGLLKGSNANGKIQRYYERGSVYKVAAEKWYPQGVDTPEDIARREKINKYMDRRLSDK